MQDQIESLHVAVSTRDKDTITSLVKNGANIDGLDRLVLCNYICIYVCMYTIIQTSRTSCTYGQKMTDKRRMAYHSVGGADCWLVLKA